MTRQTRRSFLSAAFAAVVSLLTPWRLLAAAEAPADAPGARRDGGHFSWCDRPKSPCCCEPDSYTVTFGDIAMCHEGPLIIGPYMLDTRPGGGGTVTLTRL